MEYTKARDIFNEKFELDKNLKMESHIFNLIKKLKIEFNIDADKTEIMISVNSTRVIDAVSRNTVIGYVLTLRPSPSLLQKFEKDYPEMLI